MRINKNILVFVLLFFLNIAVGYAEILPYKESYSQYETFQVEIRIDNLLEDITVDNLELRDSQNVRIPTTFYILRPKDYYFVYFALPTAGNYTFAIKDVSYSKNGLLVKEDELYTFEVKPSLALSVLPGAFLIDATDKRYIRLDLQLKNYNRPSEIKIASRFLEDSFVLGDEKTIALTINAQDLNFPFGAKEIEESLVVTYKNTGQDYKVPIWITKETESQVTSYKHKIPKIAFVNSKPTGGYYDKINLTLNYNESRSGEIKFQNLQNYPLYDIKFKLTHSLEKIIRLEYTTLNVLQPSALGSVVLVVNEKSTPGTFVGNLTLTTDSYASSFPIYITVKREETKKTTTTTLVTTTTILPSTAVAQPTMPINTLIILAFITLIAFAAFVLKKKKIKLFPFLV